MRPRLLVIPGLAAALVAVVALLVRNQPPTQPAPRVIATAIVSGHTTIAISDYDFMPKALTVKVGTRVTWTNHDATAHTATADHGGFDAGTIQPKASRTIDFTRPGTYTYHCAFHAFMTATITVKR
jgi:plastocyanin